VMEHPCDCWWIRRYNCSYHCYLSLLLLPIAAATYRCCYLSLLLSLLPRDIGFEDS